MQHNLEAHYCKNDYSMHGDCTEISRHYAYEKWEKNEKGGNWWNAHDHVPSSDVVPNTLEGNKTTTNPALTKGDRLPQHHLLNKCYDLLYMVYYVLPVV